MCGQQALQAQAQTPPLGSFRHRHGHWATQAQARPLGAKRQYSHSHLTAIQAHPLGKPQPARPRRAHFHTVYGIEAGPPRNARPSRRALIRLQPPLPTVTASATYGYSLRYMRRRPERVTLGPTVAPARRAADRGAADGVRVDDQAPAALAQEDAHLVRVRVMVRVRVRTMVRGRGQSRGQGLGQGQGQSRGRGQGSGQQPCSCMDARTSTSAAAAACRNSKAILRDLPRLEGAASTAAAKARSMGRSTCNVRGHCTRRTPRRSASSAARSSSSARAARAAELSSLPVGRSQVGNSHC